jgi:hypothetical protein
MVFCCRAYLTHLSSYSKTKTKNWSHSESWQTIKQGFPMCWFLTIVIALSSAQVTSERHDISVDGPHLFPDDCHYNEWYFLLSLLMSLVTLITVKATSLVYKVAYECSELQINPPQYWFMALLLSITPNTTLPSKPNQSAIQYFHQRNETDLFYLIPLACVDCNDSLSFSGASSFPLVV